MRKLRAVLAGAGLTAALAACGNGPPPDVLNGANAASSGAPAGTVVPPSTAAAATVNGTDGPAFSPTSTSVKVGQVVLWTNGGVDPHTITFSDANNSSLNDPGFTAGTKFAIKFTAAGKYAYTCQVHPGMNGEIDVS